MDCKGLETVRRDNCPLVSNVLSNCLEKLLLNRDAALALQYAKKVGRLLVFLIRFFVVFVYKTVFLLHYLSNLEACTCSSFVNF